MIYTSYFAFIPKLPANILKISISLFTPSWAQIDGRFPCLNPTEQLLKKAKSEAIPVEEAMEKYRDEILEKLSPVKVYEELIEILNTRGKKISRFCAMKNPAKYVIVGLWPNGLKMEILFQYLNILLKVISCR